MVEDHEPIRPLGYRFGRRVEDHVLYTRVKPVEYRFDLLGPLSGAIVAPETEEQFCFLLKAED